MEPALTLSPLVIDTGLHWLGVTCYILATLANLSGVIFLRAAHERASYRFILAGLVSHGAGLSYRWVLSGHGPYLAKYEVLSSSAWVALFLFLVFTRLSPRLRQGSVVVFPAGFLLVAIGLFTNPEVKRLPPAFTSIWLLFHVGFYKIALATLLMGVAFSLLYLLRPRSTARWLQRLPPLAEMDLIAYRFAGFGFVCWGIAMLSGSIWAYHSWGRFWGWDPIEIWSLLTWISFGIYLHLRRFFAWQGDRAAGLFLCCFVLSLIALFFAGVMTSSLHGAYFQ